MSKPYGPQKDLRKKLALQREVDCLNRVIERRRNGDSMEGAIIPVKGTPEYAAEELRAVMKLPAAEAAVFKFAHAAKLSEKIYEHMDSGDPELEMHAMDISQKMISSVIKAQKKMAANVTINTQINTGGVPVAGLGTPQRDQLPPSPAPSSRPAAPSASDAQPSSDSSPK